MSLALPPGSGSGSDVSESELHHSDEEVPAEIPAVEVTSPEEVAEPAPSPERNLWDDVESILTGKQRAIRTTEILKKLIEGVFNAGKPILAS